MVQIENELEEWREISSQEKFKDALYSVFSLHTQKNHNFLIAQPHYNQERPFDPC